MIPGLIISFYVRFYIKTSKSEDFVMIISSFFAFIMSIMWLKFTADTIMDLI